ncbi:class I SAM-dependent methyltransferase [Nocardia alni]|uniref:class I SAM-dependent methyltransferase n=1 Tax=Nocardia alni TaxID=2815723 RepID=UPI001C21443A|nr:class I SAM-dependent methyltransferase [Nocardia alni]
MKNLWLEHSSQLADAYTRNAGKLRFELITYALQEHMPTGPLRIADVGGGFGMQAIILARAGHHVTVLDIDKAMLDHARGRLSNESEAVRTRIDLVLGDGLNARKEIGTGFDLACCHSVLMYMPDPAPLLCELVHLVRPTGLVSVLSTNGDAIAMRSGLQGRWEATIASLRTGKDQDDKSLPTYDHTRRFVSETLENFGAEVQAWYGVGVFVDHLTTPPPTDQLADICVAEWLAGQRDPYRDVARCFHLLALRK